MLGAFLGFFARDIANNPERLRMMDAYLLRRLRILVADVEVDLDAPLSVDDD